VEDVGILPELQDAAVERREVGACGDLVEPGLSVVHVTRFRAGRRFYQTDIDSPS